MAGRGKKYVELTATHCSRARPGDKVDYLPDRGPGSVRGLRLCVRPDGAKLWMLRYRLPHVDGVRESAHGLGSYPSIGLADARERARQALRSIGEGVKPGIAKRIRVTRNVEAGKRTLEKVAQQWLEHGARHGFKARGGKGTRPWSAHHVERNGGLVRRFLLPKLGKLPVSEITETAVLDILRDAYEGGTRESARRAAVIARQIMAFAVRRKYVGTNPLNSTLLDAELPKPEVRHFAAIKPEEVGPMLKVLDERGPGPVVRAAILLMLYTGLRDGALRGARWSEIDLDTAAWSVPAERMKSRREHRVPLPTQALDALRGLAMLTYTGPNSFVFAGSGKAGFLAENTLRVALHAMGYKVTAHGFRSLMTDKLNLAGFNPDWIERQLDHVMKDKTRASYLRTDFFDHRRPMMQWFADWCEAERKGAATPMTPDNVVMLRRVA